MNEPIEETYFNWLYSKVASTDVPTPSTTHWHLLRELHRTEFVWLLSGDDNRAEDGLELRREFYNAMRFTFQEEFPWEHVGCSVLEMLIAFSRRAEFQTNIPSRDWFWKFLENLDLHELDDAHYDEGFIPYVDDVLDRFIWRTYGKNGEGGLFPLRFTGNDQTKVEIWYQFAEYIDELEEV